MSERKRLSKLATGRQEEARQTRESSCDCAKIAPMPPIIAISNLTKTYASGFQALKKVDLEIRKGEIFALLGPNGAGKTTLISIICGIVTPTGGVVVADGRDIWANSFEQLQFIPMVIVTPLTFLGGAFYSIDMLPPAWRTATLFNPVVYLISGFRWSFYETSDIDVGASLAITLGYFVICLAVVGWIFRTGYRLKS
jgi:ABC transporter/ABC-2 type transporter